ncbi:MAG: amidase family protein, partial [Stellaceae bacterium]
DPQDPASADVPVPDYRAALTPRLDGVRIGVIRHFHERDAVAGFGADSAPNPAYVAAFDAACRTLEGLGARLVDLQLSPLIDYLDTNRLIMLAEAYALHEKDFQERPQDFGHHMFARIALGAFLTAADYVEATRQRRELCLEFARALSQVDVAVAANATGPAPRIDTLPTFGTFERASYTGPFNLTGSPAL